MFIKETRSHVVTLPASKLSTSIQSSILSLLYTDLESTTTAPTFILTILRVESIGDGVITTTGAIEFKVDFECVSINILPDMIIECKVVEVNAMGLFAQIGPVNLFVSHHQVPQAVKENVMEGSVVRMRVKGVRYDKGVSVVGSLNEEYLGVVL